MKEGDAMAALGFVQYAVEVRIATPSATSS